MQSQAINDQDYSLFKTKDENSITFLEVFAGIRLKYHDFHSYQYTANDIPLKDGTLLINYCREGRIEWEIEQDRYFYLGKGDLSIHVYSGEQKRYFPLEHYHGISVAIDIEQVTTIGPMLRSFGVDLRQIAERFCGKNMFYVERADTTVEHIFSQLYQIPDEVKDTYTKIKILELLLFLSVLKISDYSDKDLYIRKTDIEKIKEIREYLIGHIDRHITTRDLAAMFSLSETSIKSNFKSIYGIPIFTFVRTYRMQKAAWMLKHTPHSVTEIALAVGYNNASKFASAFKEEMGLPPSQYSRST